MTHPTILILLSVAGTCLLTHCLAPMMGGDSYTDRYEKQAHNTGAVAGSVFSDFHQDSSCLRANPGILPQLANDYFLSCTFQ
jgi:hypothetical protein